MQKQSPAVLKSDTYKNMLILCGEKKWNKIQRETQTSQLQSEPDMSKWTCYKSVCLENGNSHVNDKNGDVLRTK